MRIILCFLAIIVLIVVAGAGEFVPAEKLLDRHVHLMSPDLIAYWKKAGVPFSKDEKFYSDIETVADSLGTRRFYAVSMAHTWNHPEFGKVENEAEMVAKENDFVIASAKKLGKSVKAFCSVNPMRSYALDEVKRCQELGVFGIKFHHNANQIYLTEPEHVRKVFPVWEFAAKKKLRILVHFDNSHPKFGARDIGIFFNEVLAKINPAKIQVAHMGTSGGFSDKTMRVVDAFRNEFARATFHNRKHRIVFDLSAVALDKNSQGVSKLSDEDFKKLADLIRSIGVDKFVFGTDYPLYAATDYRQILEQKVGLTKREIRVILKNRF